MKDKILMLVIGILIGAIITSAGFLIFGGNNRGKGRGNMTPPNFSKDKGNFDFNNIDPSKIPERPTQKDE